jgi:hypothetical protein
VWLRPHVLITNGMELPWHGFAVSKEPVENASVITLGLEPLRGNKPESLPESDQPGDEFLRA